MNIEIRQPELEIRIHEAMESGEFPSVDDLLIKALQSSRSNAANDEIHRRRLLDWLVDAGPGWNLHLHPELAGGAAQWVEALRHNDEEIDSANASR